MFIDLFSVTVGFVYVNILGYFFHSTVSRSLGPIGYGEFLVVYSFMLTVGNVAGLLSAVSVKTLIENFHIRYNYLMALRRVGILIGMIFSLTGIILSPILRDFLHVSSSSYFFIIAIVWFSMFMVSVEKSFLQSIGKFNVFALCNSVELTIRLIFAYLMLYLGFGIGGVLFSSFVGVFTILIFLFLYNGKISAPYPRLNIKKMFKIALYVSPSSFFIYADDIFIRRIFDEYTAGLFASASIVGKILIWLTVVLLSVYFPKFVQSKIDKSLQKFVLQMFGLVVIAEVVAQLTIFLIGKHIFLLMFGAKFEPAFELLSCYFLSILPLLFCIVFISLATAIEKGIILIYIHLFCYYLGFLVLDFNTVNDYFKYIFFINFAFTVIYCYLFRREIKIKKIPFTLS